MSADALGIGRYRHTDWTSLKVKSWVGQLTAGRPTPSYGSWEWCSAPVPIAIAAALKAAEAYRLEGLYLPQALADELAAARQLLDEQDARAFADLAGRIVAFDDLARRAAGLAKLETHEELQRRRSA